MSIHHTDYLIVGAGAVGLAFADTLLAETSESEITIVDRFARPGGHWNFAYRFVALHQPSAFYGVNSLPLGSGSKDTHGTNAGYYELATGSELLAYFDAVVHRRLLPTGRVHYFPMSDYLGDGRLRSRLTGRETQINVRRKLVQANYQAPCTPATNKRNFEVEPGARVVLPHTLTDIANAIEPPPSRFVIIGAGKTAMDVCIWLRTSGVPASLIVWVVPRDSWLLNRQNTQPGLDSFHDSMGGQAAQMEAFAAAQSVDDLFDRLESNGIMLRVFPNVRPSMFHYATISMGELEALQTIENVIRMGHVLRAGEKRLVLEDGEVGVPANVLYVDCTASAVERRPAIPVFHPDSIVCQLVKAPYPTLSAAVIAYVEAHYHDDDIKNTICEPVPVPDRPEDYLQTMLANFRNKVIWDKEPALRRWIRSSRLDGFGKIVDAVQPEDIAKMDVLNRIRNNGFAAAANLRRLIG